MGDDLELVLYPDLRGLGIPYSRAYLNELEKQGRFPRRVRLNGASGRAVAWVRGEIKTYAAAQIAARDQTPADAESVVAQAGRAAWAKKRPHGPGSMLKYYRKARGKRQRKAAQAETSDSEAVA